MGADDPVGLLGLGLMGTAIGSRLIADGHEVVGYDPVADARDAHAERGGVAADSIAEVAAGCRRIVLSLPNGQVTHEVCLSPGGVRDHAAVGTLVIDTSTILPEEAQEAADGLAGAGVAFYDAGLSGNSPMVARGEALGVVGGPAQGYADVEEVLRAVCFEVRHVGGTGDGMRAKLLINAVLTINRFAVAEALVFAEKLGLDGDATLGFLRSSAAYSKAMDMWGKRMVDRDYHPPGSRIRQHNKDAQITMQLGKQVGAPLLATTQVNNVTQIALANGYGDADNAVIADMLRMLAGVDPIAWPPQD